MGFLLGLGALLPAWGHSESGPVNLRPGIHPPNIPSIPCEAPVKNNMAEILSLARLSLSTRKSPQTQREVALQSLMKLRAEVTEPAAQGFSEDRRSVIEGEIFDILFENFSAVCLLKGMPMIMDLVREGTGLRLSNLLSLYKKLVEDPDDVSISASTQDRYRIRLLLDGLLLDIGKFNGWKDLDFDRAVSDEATDWFLRFYDLRSNAKKSGT